MSVNPNCPVVAFVADASYLIPLAASVSSVISNLRENAGVRIFIVDAGVNQTGRDKIARLADGNRIKIEWLSPSDSQHDLLQTLPNGYVGRNCYYKMLLPEMLGPEFTRAIYLDCDVIVESDICELWEEDLGVNYILAAHDLINPYVSSPFGIKTWKELGRDADDLLFNSGVMVMNMERWRAEEVLPRLVAYLTANRNFVQLCDQDAMNAVFHGRWGQLDPLWNVLPYMKVASDYCLLEPEAHLALIMKARILHFCGPGKPWSGRSSHPRKDRFFHYLDMTPWVGWRPHPWIFGPDTIAYYLRRVEVAFRRVISSR